MTRTLSVLALMASLVVAPAVFAEEGEVSAEAKDKLTAQLTEQGYDVRKFEIEDGLIEVYVVKDGKTVSMFFNDKLELVKTEE